MSHTSVDWSQLQLPAPIPALVVTPDHTQIFMFSAATWNRHHIHYSKDAALAEGLPDVVAARAHRISSPA
jgi:hydroxyacyl-ACP dehydratase HTD2-like protein with hotdog domain